MIPSLVAEVNSFAPYQVFEGNEANSMIFFSDIDSEYVVSFIKDETLDDCSNVFHFLIEAKFTPHPSNDVKVGETVACIAKAFFNRYPAHILTFVCDISDSRQSVRQRLFSRWFHKFNQNGYVKFDWQVEAEECMFYASMIGRKDNADFEDYKEAYSEFVSSIQK